MQRKPFCKQEPVYKSEDLVEALLPKFPWIDQWVIKASFGLADAVSGLLADLEEILNSNQEIKFLRIIEEPHEKEPFIRELVVFIELKNNSAARSEAIGYATKLAIKSSKNRCYRCAGNLKFQKLHDEEDPFVQDILALSSGENREFRNNYMFICERCLLDKYGVSEQGPKEGNEYQDLDQVSSPVERDKEKNTDAKKTKQDDSECKKEKTTDENKSDNEENVKSNRVTLFKMEEVDQLESDYKGATRDHANRVRHLVKKIRENSADKRLATINNDWREYCQTLEQNFPNFIEVIGFVRTQFALSAVSDNVLRMPPFLMLGEPGVGKTEFMLTLANDLNTTLEVIDISTSQSGASLSGSDNYWSNTKTGMLFNSLMFGELANPILLLDEIDKGRSEDGYDPLSALHQLLEQRQAKEFYDLSVPEIKIDASHVLWIATANKIEFIESQIVDRFTVFNISPPTKDQMKVIVNNLYQRFLEQNPSGHYFKNSLNPDVLDQLCEYHPREVRKVLEQAFGLAACEQRNYLIQQDLLQGSQTKRNKAIGFIN